MDRVTRFNVIAMSGKAVEACGDVDTKMCIRDRFKQEEADPVYEHIQDHGDSPHAEIRLFLDAQQPQDLLAAAGASRCQRHARPDAAYQPADDAGRDCLVKQSFRRDRDYPPG